MDLESLVADPASGANLSAPIGKVVYIQMLNDQGGTEADITVTNMALLATG